MIFTETSLKGVFVIDMEVVSDERGYFARTFCAEEFAARGLNTGIAQCSVSHNAKAGTLRGMHFQMEPHAEDKFVRCVAGSIFDAVVDVRPTSPTYGQWFGVELTAENHRALFVPKGFAHGFITLKDTTEVSYMISEPYAPAHARGFHWNDPAIGIKWPITPKIVSVRDAAYPPLTQVLNS